MNNEYLILASRLAREGGLILKENFQKLKGDQIHEKGPGDLVTDFDRAIEKKYATAIQKAFPDHGILGEEGTRVNPGAEYQWIMDPLDGTKNFVEGRPRFCTMLCLFQNQRPALSVIYEPLTDQLFSAVKGEGAECNGKKINVSKTNDPKKSMLLYGEGRSSQEKRLSTRLIPILEKKVAKILRLPAGNQMTQVAEGAAEVCLLSDVAVWDVAPGVLIIQEAGGRITDFDGSEWSLKTTGTIMTNGTKIHDEIVKIIQL